MNQSLLYKFNEGYVLITKLWEWYTIVKFRLKRRKKYIKDKALSCYPKQQSIKDQIDRYKNNNHKINQNASITNELRQRDQALNIHLQQEALNSALNMKRHTEPKRDFTKNFDQQLRRQTAQQDLHSHMMLNSQILSSLGLMNVKSPVSYKSSPTDFNDSE